MQWNIWERQADGTWSMIESGLSHQDAVDGICVRSLCERAPGQGSLVALPAGEEPIERATRDL